MYDKISGAVNPFVIRLMITGLLTIGLNFGMRDGVATAQQQTLPLYDHHVHVLSPRLVADWKSLGMPFSRPDSAYTDASQILKDSQVGGAFLISMAHLYTTDPFRNICATEEIQRRMVAAENDYIAISVARHPDRLLGFFSVNPFSNYAMDEMQRCLSNPNLTGLKLHLPACGFDLGNDEHWQRLSEILKWAAKEDVPVLLHLTAGEAVDLEKAIWFWKEIIEPHPKIELYLAHLGSVGGFNESSENLLRGYHRWRVENQNESKSRIYFDLSGAIVGENPEVAPTSDQQCARLSDWILKIGVDHFVFASDYPVFPVAQTRSELVDRLTLPAEDIAKLLSNRSPRFDAAEKKADNLQQ